MFPGRIQLYFVWKKEDLALRQSLLFSMVYTLSLILCQLLRAVHRYLLSIRRHRPDSAGANTSAYTTANALLFIRNIFKRTIMFCNPADRLLGAGFTAHMTITACAAADTAVKIVIGGRQIFEVTFHEVSCVQPFFRDNRFRRQAEGFAAHIRIN